MSIARIFMLVTAILEAILGIPFIGGSIVISMFYTPLFVMFVLHIVALVFVAKEQKSKQEMCWELLHHASLGFLL